MADLEAGPEPELAAADLHLREMEAALGRGLLGYANAYALAAVALSVRAITIDTRGILDELVEIERTLTRIAEKRPS